MLLIILYVSGPALWRCPPGPLDQVLKVGVSSQQGQAASAGAEAFPTLGSICIQSMQHLVVLNTANKSGNVTMFKTPQIKERQMVKDPNDESEDAIHIDLFEMVKSSVLETPYSPAQRSICQQYVRASQCHRQRHPSQHTEP